MKQNKLNQNLIAKYISTTRNEGVGNGLSKSHLRKVRSLIRNGLLDNPLKSISSKKELNYNKGLLRAVINGLMNLFSVFSVRYKGTILNPRAHKMNTLDLIKLIKYEINRPMSIVMGNQCEEAPSNYFNIFNPPIYKLINRIANKKNERSFSFALGMLNLKRCAPTMPKSFEDVAIRKHKATLNKTPSQKLSKRDRRNFSQLCKLFVDGLQYRREVFLANASASVEIPFKDGGVRSVLNDLSMWEEMLSRENEMEYHDALEELDEEYNTHEARLAAPWIEDWCDMTDQNDFLIIDDQKWHIIESTKNKHFYFEERRRYWREFRAKQSVNQLIAQGLIYNDWKYENEIPIAKVAVVQDPMKTRIITKEHTIHHYLKPLHQRILDRLENYKIFSVLGQKVNSYTFTHIFKKKDDEIIASVDYEAATDNVLPEFYQIFHDRLVENVIDPDIKFLLYQNKKFRDIIYPDGDIIRQQNGQLMGSYMSSIVLNLYNLFGVLRSLYPEKIFKDRKILDAYLRKLGKKAKFCGDDLILVATKKELMKHKEYCKKIGMTLSKGKSYENKKFGIFCSLGFSFNGTYIKSDYNRNGWFNKSFDRFDLVKFPMVQFLEDQTTDFDNKSIPGNDDIKSKKAKTYSIDQKLEMLQVAIQGKRSMFSKYKFYKIFMNKNREHLSRSCRSLWAPKSKNGFGLKLKYFRPIFQRDRKMIIRKNITDDALKLWYLSDIGERFIPKYLREVDSIFKVDETIKTYLPATSVFHQKIRSHRQMEIFSRNKFDLEEKGEEDRLFLRKRWNRISQEWKDKEIINRNMYERAVYKYEELKNNSASPGTIQIMINLVNKYRNLMEECKNYLPNELTKRKEEMIKLLS